MLNFNIQLNAPISTLFLQSRITTFREAATYIRSLPYKRISDTSNIALVLIEGRGTCSSKHAVLAELGKEQQQPISLRLGFYEMNGDNTPGTGTILKYHGLKAILEAHCYLSYEGTRFDFTRDAATEKMNLPILLEEEIVSSQIGSYKNRRHKEELIEWLKKNKIPVTFEEAWKIREECIAALSCSTITVRK